MSEMKSNFLADHTASILMASLLLLLTACSNGMEVSDRDFGKSVRLMVQSQIYNKAAAANPTTKAPEGIDGNKSIADLEELERPVNAEKEMLNYIKVRKYEVGGK